MTHPFTHPSSEKLLGEISLAFQEKKILQRKDRHIIFLCGGSIKKYSRSLRSKFYKYAKKELSQFRIFLAEDATKDLSLHGDPEFINIAEFENLIAEVADCILIFPESAGSIAEVAYFSNNMDAIEKLLVVNDVNRQHDSFINIGPLNKIDKYSNFRPTILVNYKKPDFNVVKTRLTQRLHAQQRKRFHALEFKELSSKHKLFIIFQLIIIFQVLTFEGLLNCLGRVFGFAEKKEVRHLLSLLIAGKYVNRIGAEGEYFMPNKNVESFLEFVHYDVSNLKANVIYYYKNYHNESYRLLEKV